MAPIKDSFSPQRVYCLFVRLTFAAISLEGPDGSRPQREYSRRDFEVAFLGFAVGTYKRKLRMGFALRLQHRNLWHSSWIDPMPREIRRRETRRGTTPWN